MGWGGAWRQEELKRFSSWVTTKVGLSRRAVGPLAWRVWGSKCNVGFYQWGQHFLSLFHHTQTPFRVQIWEFAGHFINLVPLSKSHIKGLEQILPNPLWGMQSKREKSTGRGLVKGTTEMSPSGSAWLCFCGHCSRNSNEEGRLSSLVTEALNITDFTFVGSTAQREAMT